MDINVDQGVPRGDLGRFENGKYLYELDNGKFDIDRFNRDFDQYKEQRKREMQERLDKKLSELNNPPHEPPAYDLSIGQIAINIKDSMFNIIDDIINFKFTWDILLKSNRLFYLGLVFIIFASIAYLYYYFIPDEAPPKVIHIHEIQLNLDQNGAKP